MTSAPSRNLKLWYLQNIHLFEGMSASEMSELEQMTSMAVAKRGEPIYLPGDPSDRVYLLKDGRVKISRITEDGEQLTLAILKPGEIFGEVEALEESPHATLAEPLETANLCLIQRKDFLNILQKMPGLAIRLTKLMGFRLRRVENRIEELVFRDVPSRLAHLLRQLSKDFGQPDNEGGLRIGLRLTHQEMANLIGSTRETVSATLGDFRKRGLLHFEGRHVVITQEETLATLAGPPFP